jgi:hypothetical protein
MNATQMLAAVLALPDPDLMVESRLEDGPGAGSAYLASTVAKLLAKERRKIAALQTAAAALLALDLENDGNTSEWAELQAALAGLRKALAVSARQKPAQKPARRRPTSAAPGHQP